VAAVNSPTDELSVRHLERRQEGLDLGPAQFRVHGGASLQLAEGSRIVGPQASVNPMERLRECAVEPR
jgi:hypothetical protein